MNLKLFFLSFLCTICILFSTVKICDAQSTKADLLIGDWTDSNKETLVHCYKQNGKYYGKTTWIENLADRGKPLPKSQQHWINMVVMKDFEFNVADNEWANGTIYQPRTDKTYTAFVKLKDKNTLQVTGYVWFRFLSESEIFTRVNN